MKHGLSLYFYMLITISQIAVRSQVSQETITNLLLS